MNKVSDKILKRVYLLFGMVALFAVVILAKVVQIQFVQKDRWLAAVENERIYEKRVPATRGNILADGGEVLATSQPFYMMPIDPSRIDTTEKGFWLELDTLCNLMADRFGSQAMRAGYFHDLIVKTIRFRDERGRPDRHLYLLDHKIDFEDYRIAREWPILRRSRYQGGLIMEKLNNTRFYPYNSDSLARITLGVLSYNNDTVPLKGIEYAFHKYLKGNEGIALVQRITGGHEMPLEVFQEDEDGADVETTINVGIQDIVETELRSAVLKHKAKYGVAILMEVKTGELKAVANYPETQNHALASRIEPGSTFKLASFMAALDDKKIKLDDSIDAHKGTWQFYDRVMRDHLDYDKVTYRTAFEESINTITARMIDEIYARDLDAWFKHLDNFGLTNKVMVQEHIVGEPVPKVVRPTEADWNGTTLPWMAIGYNTQLTPMQILTFYNAVANNGKMMEPILVKRIRLGAKIIHEYRSKVLNKQIASEATIKNARELLEGVVLRGTARRVQIGECKIAGKTGTAKKYNKELNRYESVYQASFCGYFPADNPRYSLYVMVDEPSEDEYYGASVAGPVFAQIAQQVFNADVNLVPEFKPTDLTLSSPYTRLVHQGNAQAFYKRIARTGPTEAEGLWVTSKEDAGKLEFKKANIQPGKVPNVYGMSAKDAMVLLETLGMKVQLKGNGKVKSQSIHAGEPISGHSAIVLQLSL